MPESTPNPVEKKSVRLSPRFWNYVKDEQARIRKEAGGREPPQEDVADLILDDALAYRANIAGKSDAISSVQKVTNSSLTTNENQDYNCRTPREAELRQTLAFILNSGDERIIASVTNFLAASEDFVRLEVVRGPANAETPPGEQQAPGDPQLSKKSGRNVQIVGGSDKGIRGKRGA